MKTSYHNTTNVPCPARYEEKAKTQEDKILEWFRYYKQSATASKIHQPVLRDCPITSVRRGLSNLTAQGELEKTERKERGPYGRPEYVWKLSESPQRALL